MNKQTVPDDVIERLQRFRDATDFWDKHEYSTRLYFGDGADDFIHRHSLDTVIAALQRQREAVAQHEVGEAVYQVEICGAFTECTKDAFERSKCKKRILYTIPLLPQDARELLEKAATKCDEIADEHQEAMKKRPKDSAEQHLHRGISCGADSCAKAIRALIPTEKEPS